MDNTQPTPFTMPMARAVMAADTIELHIVGGPLGMFDFPGVDTPRDTSMDDQLKMMANAAGVLVELFTAPQDLTRAEVKAGLAQLALQLEKRQARAIKLRPTPTTAPRGKHGKRPSRNAMRAHRASQRACAKWRGYSSGKCYTIKFDRIDTRGMEIHL